MKLKLYVKDITSELIRQIESGVKDWRMPWDRVDWPHNVSTRHHYRGLNFLNLCLAAPRVGYGFSTKKAWVKKGCRIKAKQSPEMVFAYIPKSTEQTNVETPDNEPPIAFFPVWVYGEKQVVGYKPKTVVHLDITDRITKADRFFGRLGANVLHGHRQAAYEPSTDRILMPDFERFHQVESYYSTLAHEHIHWTKSRVKRNHKFGLIRNTVPTRQSYAYEELVAELGAAFVCYRLGIEKSPRPDHASYLDSWLRMFREHELILWDATREAQKAADFLLRKGGVLKMPGRKPDARALRKAA